jgi:hypothetical protein
MGGCCDSSGTLCTHGARTRATPPSVRISHLGVTAGGVPIELNIVNESEYRASNANLNGLQRRDDGTRIGSFAVVNLLAPIRPSRAGVWRTDATWVQLRFALSAAGQPARLTRTFFTWHDFDAGRREQATECVILGAEIASVHLSPHSSLRAVRGEWNGTDAHLRALRDAIDDTDEETPSPSRMGSPPPSAVWGARTYCASEYGVFEQWLEPRTRGKLRSSACSKS